MALLHHGMAAQEADEMLFGYILEIQKRVVPEGREQEGSADRENPGTCDQIQKFLEQVFLSRSPKLLQGSLCQFEIVVGLQHVGDDMLCAGCISPAKGFLQRNLRSLADEGAAVGLESGYCLF